MGPSRHPARGHPSASVSMCCRCPLDAGGRSGTRVRDGAEGAGSAGDVVWLPSAMSMSVCEL